MRKRRWFLGLSLMTLLVACGLSVVNQKSLSPSPGVTLTVGAASDLQFAFEEMGKQFEQETNTKVVFNFGSTGQLAQQIAQGAPMDLFAAANKAFVEDLDRKGRVISDTKQIYGRGRIVLWVRQDSPLPIKQIQELTNPAIKRIAIANPEHAPYGIAAKQALESVGIWDELQPKLILGKNVSQTLQYGQTGNVDAAIVALSLAVVTPNGRYEIIADNLHQPLDQMLAVVEGTPHAKQARQFAEFINGEIGRPLMGNYGFILPGEEPIQ
ncbi:molybdate ABC transporter substrate-binding protein [Coleofasciculus sp.]|uniref:molybdate ABC transporter substrate-binding protein n=1 Tax=Coleofasciculus sp. TaxID=3100458 RepID=UPI003A19D7CE